MTTAQRIEQILSFFEAHHHYKGSAGHPAVDKRIERDVEALRGDLEALLLSLQDEQKEELKALWNRGVKQSKEATDAYFKAEFFDEFLNEMEEILDVYVYNPHKEKV